MSSAHLAINDLGSSGHDTAVQDAVRPAFVHIGNEAFADARGPMRHLQQAPALPLSAIQTGYLRSLDL